MKNALLVSIGTLAVAAVACGSSPTAVHPSPSPTPSPSASASPSAGSVKIFVFETEPGSSVGGSVQVSPASGGVALTATVAGLKPGASYLADADPLPCAIFAGGPSQSFAKAFTAGGDGKATVTWTVPAAMAGSASIQAVSGGAYQVLACADLA